MKIEEYVNSLIKEKEELKSACKTQIEKIRLMKREITKLNNTISKNYKKILKLENENESINMKIKNELIDVKNDLSNLKVEHDALKLKYNEIVKENEQFKFIFDEIEKNM
jgi:hypothetical protein